MTKPLLDAIRRYTDANALTIATVAAAGSAAAASGATAAEAAVSGITTNGGAVTAVWEQARTAVLASGILLLVAADIALALLPSIGGVALGVVFGGESLPESGMQIIALEQLLAVHEQTSLEQATRPDRPL